MIALLPKPASALCSRTVTCRGYYTSVASAGAGSWLALQLVCSLRWRSHEHPTTWETEDGDTISVRGFYKRLNLRVDGRSAVLDPEQALEFAAKVLEIAVELQRQVAQD